MNQWFSGAQFVTAKKTVSNDSLTHPSTNESEDTLVTRTDPVSAFHESVLTVFTTKEEHHHKWPHNQQEGGDANCVRQPLPIATVLWRWRLSE